MFRLKLISFTLLLFSTLLGYSQMDEMHIEGDLKDGFSDMTGAFVLVYSGGQQVKRVKVSSSGIRF